MRIAQVAPLWMGVPPKDYGGIELLIHLMAEELTRRGHEVTLFAAAESHTSARLRAVCEQSIIDAMAASEAWDHEYYATAALCEAMREADSFDVIHSHVGASNIPLASCPGPPSCTPSIRR